MFPTASWLLNEIDLYVVDVLSSKTIAVLGLIGAISNKSSNINALLALIVTFVPSDRSVFNPVVDVSLFPPVDKFTL